MLTQPSLSIMWSFSWKCSTQFCLRWKQHIWVEKNTETSISNAWSMGYMLSSSAGRKEPQSVQMCSACETESQMAPHLSLWYFVLLCKLFHGCNLSQLLEHHWLWFLYSISSWDNILSFLLFISSETFSTWSFWQPTE